MKREFVFSDSQFLTSSEKHRIIKAWDRFLGSLFRHDNASAQKHLETCFIADSLKKSLANWSARNPRHMLNYCN